MGNSPYSLDIPDIMYHPVNPAGQFLSAFQQERARAEEQRRHEEEQRARQEAVAYQRQRDSMGDRQTAEQGKQKAIEQLAGLVDSGRVPEAQALAAAHGLAFNPGGPGGLQAMTNGAPGAMPDQAPQLQMPGAAQDAPPASFRLPGMQLRPPPGDEPQDAPGGNLSPGRLRIPGVNMAVPQGDAPDAPDVGAFARKFAPRAPGPNMAGLAGTPEALERGPDKRPTLDVNGQQIELDPNGASSRADAVSRRTIQQQEEVRAASEDLIRQRQEAAQARLFDQQRALQEDRQGATDEQIRLRAQLRPKKAATGGANADGSPDVVDMRTVYNADGTVRGLAPGTAKVSAEGKSARAMYAQVKPIRNGMEQLKGLIDKTDYADRGVKFTDDQLKIKAKINQFQGPISQFLGSGTPQEKEAQRMLDAMTVSISQGKEVSKANIDSFIAYIDDAYEAKTASLVPTNKNPPKAAATGAAAPAHTERGPAKGKDGEKKTVGGHTFTLRNGWWE